MGRFRRRLLGLADDKEAEEEEEDELRLEPEEIRAGKDAESRDERMSASKTPLSLFSAVSSIWYLHYL
jgi:hypothetical protein